MPYGVAYDIVLRSGKKLPQDGVCFSALSDMGVSTITYPIVLDHRVDAHTAKKVIDSMAAALLYDTKIARRYSEVGYFKNQNHIEVKIHVNRLPGVVINMALVLARYASEFPSIIYGYAWLLRQGFTPNQCLYLSHRFHLTHKSSPFDESIGEPHNYPSIPGYYSGHCLFDSYSMNTRITEKIALAIKELPAYNNNPTLWGMHNIFKYEDTVQKETIRAKMAGQYQNEIGDLGENISDIPYDRNNLPILKRVCIQLEEFYQRVEEL